MIPTNYRDLEPKEFENAVYDRIEVWYENLTTEHKRQLFKKHAAAYLCMARDCANLIKVDTYFKQDGCTVLEVDDCIETFAAANFDLD